MKICAIFNIFPLYRRPIYKRMDECLDIDFFFGDQSSENIALANNSILSNYKGKVHNIFRGHKLIWQRKAIRSAFSKRYTHYLLTGNTGILSNWIILILSRLLGRKVILWSHGLYGNERGLKLFKNLTYLKLASTIYTYNDRGRDIIINNGIKADRVITIYNSLNYEIQKNFSQQVGDASFARNYFGTDLPLVSFVGRLTTQKKIDQLLEAMVLCESSFNLIIVGDGSERLKLEEDVDRLGLCDRVWFYGECYDESMLATIISNSYFTVSPGNCGLNAIESLTYGTAIISHSNLFEQMPEVECVLELQQLCGIKLLFEQNNVVDLAQTISNALNSDLIHIGKVAKEIVASKWNSNKQIDIMVHNLR